MVLAELVAAAADSLSASLRQTRPHELRGRTLNEGLAIGKVHLYDPVVPPARLFAADAEAEELRLNDALEALRASIDAMLTRAGPVLFGESRDVLETYRLFAHDPSWEARLVEAVRSGLSAEAAVDRVRREHRARLESARDSLLRANACTIWKTSKTACCGNWPATMAGRARCRPARCWSPAGSARRSCWSIAMRASPGSRWKKLAQVPTPPSWRAPSAFRRLAGLPASSPAPRMAMR
jgi:hypothetical protein